MRLGTHLCATPLHLCPLRRHEPAPARSRRGHARPAPTRSCFCVLYILRVPALLQHHPWRTRERRLPPPFFLSPAYSHARTARTHTLATSAPSFPPIFATTMHAPSSSLYVQLLFFWCTCILSRAPNTPAHNTHTPTPPPRVWRSEPACRLRSAGGLRATARMVEARRHGLPLVCYLKGVRCISSRFGQKLTIAVPRTSPKG